MTYAAYSSLSRPEGKIRVAARPVTDEGRGARYIHAPIIPQMLLHSRPESECLPHLRHRMHSGTRARRRQCDAARPAPAAGARFHPALLDCLRLALLDCLRSALLDCLRSALLSCLRPALLDGACEAGEGRCMSNWRINHKLGPKSSGYLKWNKCLLPWWREV